MTKTEQSRRKLFEEWACKNLPTSLSKRGSSYAAMMTEKSWAAWNAALDAVVIELPEPESPESIGVIKAEDLDEYQALEARMGAQYSAIHKCRLSIESTGLGLKIK